ncbi:hypothetical protein [Clostridium uliginosum]|uniref:Uncharacterized protein n=1 Tax=Clostridium uliginosum TaxID=119641 RepID=A0A1I1IN47_9CLOT|nr:hypothetical protein [Clostridium uliginosum]SFC37676.1 hypothetical protein SAMN05421842_10318 [Clostridium uliginosum]
MEEDLIDYDYNKSMIGTFDVDNKIQAKELVIKNPQRYKSLANTLANRIEEIDFTGVPEYRAKAMIELLKSRCKMIQKF